MNPRPLLIAALTIGSTLLGAGIAIKMSPDNASSSLGERTQPSVQPSPPQVESQPLAAALPTAPNPALDQVAVSVPNEFAQIRIQVQRAIRERNLPLLRSLIQAGSVREALRSVQATESIDFENFDHSTWTVLEKALNYHCRQSIRELETRSCFERQSPQPLQ
jgi:hypothetical protein